MFFKSCASRVIMVANKDSSEKALEAYAVKTGGWLLKREMDFISLRIPLESVDLFLAFADSQGLVADRSYVRDDNTQEYLRLVAKIQAKQSLLGQYLAVLDSSGMRGIYAVARGVADLQQGLEEARGRLRGLEERMAYAEITLYFRFHDRRQPLSTGYSDFQWLNAISLPMLLEDFRRP